MHKLPPSEYCRVSALCEDADELRAPLFGVLEGNLLGWVGVDDPQAPRAACVALGTAPSDLFLLGEPNRAAFNAALQATVTQTVMPALVKDAEMGHLMLYAFSEAWREVLEALFAGQGVQRLHRTTFRYDSARFEAHKAWRSRVPPGYEVRRIDAELAEQVGGVMEHWGGVGRFLAVGFGHCIMLGTRIVSTCQTAFVGDGRAELGVGTHRDHRRRGLATLAGAATIEACLARGLAPEWGCFYNEASGALARTLGFAEKPGLTVDYIQVTR